MRITWTFQCLLHLILFLSSTSSSPALSSSLLSLSLIRRKDSSSTPSSSSEESTVVFDQMGGLPAVDEAYNFIKQCSPIGKTRLLLSPTYHVVYYDIIYVISHWISHAALWSKVLVKTRNATIVGYLATDSSALQLPLIGHLHNLSSSSIQSTSASSSASTPSIYVLGTGIAGDVRFLMKYAQTLVLNHTVQYDRPPRWV